MNKTPCEADPDKWYIDRDGRKYDDKLLVDEDEVRAALSHRAKFTVTVTQDEAAAVVDDLVAEKVKARLVERRHARDACHTACPVRLQCLDKALGNHEQYGIWGGYFPEQRRELERLIEARKSRG